MKKILALMLALAMLLGCTALAEDAAPALTKDLVILFTATVSHKMVEMALREAKRCNAPVARCHSSSASALKSLLEAQAAACTAPAG